MQKPITNGFTAEKCNFQGVPGYTVKQWYSGSVICSQFIPEKHFGEFFSAIGKTPVIIK